MAPGAAVAQRGSKELQPGHAGPAHGRQHLSFRTDRLAWLTSLVLVWYVFSWVFSWQLKVWFSSHNQNQEQPDGTTQAGGSQSQLLPLLFYIFAGNTASMALWAACTSDSKKLRADKADVTSLAGVVRNNTLDFTLMCASGIVGIAAGVVVLEYGSIQLVQVARSLGPLFTALWAFLVLGQATSAPRMACLTVTLTGTLLASWREPSFCLATALIMLTANATLTFRNTATKRLLECLGLPAGPARDSCACALLAFVSAVGLALVGTLWALQSLQRAHAVAPTSFRLPLAAFTAQQTQHQQRHLRSAGSGVQDSGTAAGLYGDAPFVLSAQGPGGADHDGPMELPPPLASLACSSVGPCRLDGTPSQQHNHAQQRRLFASTAAGEGQQQHRAGVHGSWWDAWGAVIIQHKTMALLGIYSFMYNMASQLVLANVNVVSHGMLELFKRVFVLVVAALVHPEVRWGLSNIIGTAVSVVGTVAYFYFTVHSHSTPAGGSHGSSGGSSNSQPRAQKDASGGGEREAVLAVRQHSTSSPPSSDALVDVVAELHSRSSPGQPLAHHHQHQHQHHHDGGLLGAAPKAHAVGGGAAPGAPVRLHIAQVLICLVLAASPFELGGWLPHAASKRSPAVAASSPASPAARSGGALPHMHSVLGGAEVGDHGGPGGWVPGYVRRQPRAPGLCQPYGPGGMLPWEWATAGGSDTKSKGEGGQRKGKGQHVGGIERRGQRLLGLYTGWLGHDNMGDELVSDIFLDLLLAAVLRATADGTNVTVSRSDAQLGAEAAAVPAPKGGGGRRLLQLLHQGYGGGSDGARSQECGFLDASGCDFVVLGGGSTVHDDYVKRISGALSHSSRAPLVLWGSGAQDGLPPKSTNAKYLAMMGRHRLRLLGGVRGPNTQVHLRDMAAMPWDVAVTRDPALIAAHLYEPPGTSISGVEEVEKAHPSSGSDEGAKGDEASLSARCTLEAALKDAKQAQALVVVVTPGKGVRGLQLWEAAAWELATKHKVQVVMQPVDASSLGQCSLVAKRLNERLPKGFHKVLVHQEYLRWGPVVHLYSMASAAISGRLYSGVLALAAATPTVYVSNNVKYHDLLVSLGMPINETLVDPGETDQSEQALSRLGTRMAHMVLHVSRGRNRARLAARLRKEHTETLQVYNEVMEELLQHLGKAAPERLASVLCGCDHVHVARSPPSSHLMALSLECIESSSNEQRRRK